MKLRVKRKKRRQPRTPAELQAVLDGMSLGACEDLGVDLLREGEVESALVCLREAMERGTREPLVRRCYVSGMLLLYSRLEAESPETIGAGKQVDTRETWTALLLQSQSNVERWPADPDNHLNHGMCLEHQGRYAEALAAYERGLALSPGDADLQRLRQRALVALGR